MKYKPKKYKSNGKDITTRALVTEEQKIDNLSMILEEMGVCFEEFNKAIEDIIEEKKDEKVERH